MNIKEHHQHQWKMKTTWIWRNQWELINYKQPNPTGAHRASSSWEFTEIRGWKDFCWGKKNRPDRSTIGGVFDELFWLGVWLIGLIGWLGEVLMGLVRWLIDWFDWLVWLVGLVDSLCGSFWFLSCCHQLGSAATSSFTPKHQALRSQCVEHGKQLQGLSEARRGEELNCYTVGGGFWFQWFSIWVTTLFRLFRGFITY